MIIGILGQKRNGKDTCADYLVEHYNFTKVSFADPIKQILKIMFDFNDEQLYGDKKELIHSKGNWNRTYLVVENGELLTYQFVKGNVY